MYIVDSALKMGAKGSSEQILPKKMRENLI
jgi:hypothetical protein